MQGQGWRQADVKCGRGSLSAQIRARFAYLKPIQELIEKRTECFEGARKPWSQAAQSDKLSVGYTDEEWRERAFLTIGKKNI